MLLTSSLSEKVFYSASVAVHIIVWKFKMHLDVPFSLVDSALVRVVKAKS